MMATGEAPSAENPTTPLPGVLAGIRVIELADEQAEYCGLTLAGLGADVVKVEPPGGSPTRRIGPFYKDEADPERSLFFWQYNRGKRSVELDLDRDPDRARFEGLLASADILLESTPKGTLDALGLDSKSLEERFPALIHARITPFGDDGPWSDYKASDLVHLALGGVMMNCGYDPTPDGKYDLPPIAPQMWHAYHVAGEQMSMAIMAALVYRFRTGLGQQVSCAVHEAVAKCTEVDLMSWVMRRSPIFRQTCRHARETISPHPTIAHTKDGRWVMASLGTRPGDGDRLIELLDRYGIESGMDKETSDLSKGGRFVPGTGPVKEKRDKGMEAMQRFVRNFTYENVPWREAQELGMLWAPLRKPHENALDPHWIARRSVCDIEHPEHNQSFRYATSKWIATATGWIPGRRAPLLNEDAAGVETALPNPAPKIAPDADPTRAGQASKRGKPFALDGIRILDFTWFLASAGGTRFMSAFGAESLKVELKSHPDTRMASMAPVGGREAREKATAPLQGVTDPDMGGQFNNKNPGKRGISLNVRHPKGLEIARKLVAMSDIVAEGFSPGVLDSWGLGYDTLKEIKPDIIYVQQSGMGAQGKYGRFRTVGPIANSFAGLSEMSGLPEPGRLGLFVSRLDGRLQLCARDAERALPPGADGRRAMDRRFADRSRIVHQRHDDARLVGKRANLDPDGEPLAEQTGGSARRLSLRRRRQMARHRLLYRERVAGALQCRGTTRLGGRPPLRRSRRPIGAPGRARRSSGAMDPAGRRPPPDGSVAEGGRAGGRVPNRGGPLRPRPAAGGAGMADGSHRDEDRPLAGRGSAGQAERESGLCRRHHRPRGALLRRRQRVRLRRVARHDYEGDRSAGSRRGLLEAATP